MPYLPIEIAGYLEGSPEPLFDDTEECHVDFVLSGIPPKPWSDMLMLFGLVSGGGSGDNPIGGRMNVSGRVLRLRTTGGLIVEDFVRLEQAAVKVNAAFNEQYKSALWSQRKIEEFLEDGVTRISAEELEG